MRFCENAAAAAGRRDGAHLSNSGRMRAAGLNPVDFKTRQGKLRPVVSLKLPAIMGNEFAGDVVAVGSGVTQFAVGDKVYARVAKGRMGAFA